MIPIGSTDYSGIVILFRPIALRVRSNSGQSILFPAASGRVGPTTSWTTNRRVDPRRHPAGVASVGRTTTARRPHTSDAVSTPSVINGLEPRFDGHNRASPRRKSKNLKTSEWVAAAINMAALVFVGLQVLLARRSQIQADQGQREEWARLRMQATIEVAMSTARYRESLASILPFNDRDPQIVADFLNEVDGDPEKLTAMRQYMNHLTELAVGVKKGVFDLDTLSMLAGSRIIRTVDSFAPYIAWVRSELDAQEIYKDIEQLSEMLRRHRGEPYRLASEFSDDDSSVN